MKRLIICDTLYQIIIAIQMKLTIFNGDHIDIWISDHSVGMADIANRINQEKIFNKVCFVKKKHIVYDKSPINKFSNIFSYGFGHKKVEEIDLYEEIIFYSLDLIVCGIDSIYKKIKHKVVWSRYEEGLFSYETDFFYGQTVVIQQKLSKLIGNKPFRDKIENYYCFFPNFKVHKNGWNLIEVPKLDKNLEQIKPILSRVFKFDGFDCHQRYIYFASSSDIDGHPYGETELIMKISEIVGKDNLIIKTHPRDSRAVFLDNGLNVMESTGIPWEVYQICGEIQGKVLLTTDSGSFISVTAVCPNNIRGIFLYPCVDCQSEMFVMRKENINNMLDNLKKADLCMQIFTVNNIGDIVDM